MAPEPPTQIQDFYNYIKSLDTGSLVQHPKFADHADDEYPPTADSLLKLSHRKTGELQENYPNVQNAFYDFAGRCMMNCPQPGKHVHGVQGTAVLEVKGFPGLYIYRGIFKRSPFVHKKFIDALLHDQLAHPEGETNMHEAYHVTYPDSSGPGARASFFGPSAAGLKMQPRLQDSWVSFPISVREFVKKLHWFTLGRKANGNSGPQLSCNIKALLGAVLPLKAEDATAYVSTVQEPRGLTQDLSENPVLVDMSLGCDAIFVIGKEPGEDEPKESEAPAPEPAETGNGESWRDLIEDLSSDDEGDGKHQHEKKGSTSEPAHMRAEPYKTPDDFKLAAIRVRSGDALVFSGPSRRAWHGVAKVLEGSWPAWEENWPCWWSTEDGQRLQDWRGCMKGRRIDLVVQ